MQVFTSSIIHVIPEFDYSMIPFFSILKILLTFKLIGGIILHNARWCKEFSSIFRLFLFYAN